MLPAIVFIGFDPREAAAFAVARSSIRRHLNGPVPIRGIVLSELQGAGLYTRPTEIKPGFDRPVMCDVLSRTDEYDGAMSTEFAVSRFWIPYLARNSMKADRAAGWAVFLDCDVLARANLGDLFNYREPNQKYAVRCVKHDHRPKSKTKMDNQAQVVYPRKNWSSVMMFNCDHPSNQKLTLEMLNSVPGRDLHRFAWLDDDEIGELGPEWNYLVGTSKPVPEVKIAHFTSGTPDMAGYANCEFADEWRAELARWASR